MGGSLYVDGFFAPPEPPRADPFTEIADVACRKRLEALLEGLVWDKTTAIAEGSLRDVFVEEGSLRGVFG